MRKIILVFLILLTNTLSGQTKIYKTRVKYKVTPNLSVVDSILTKDSNNILSATSVTDFVSQIGLGNYLENIVEDVTPQLGGDLDMNSQDITGVGSINIAGNITNTATLQTANVSASNNVSFANYANTRNDGASVNFLHTGVSGDLLSSPVSSIIPVYQAGANITIDSTDPLLPVISASGGDIPSYVIGWESERTQGNVVTIGKGVGKLRLTNGSSAIVGIDGVDFNNQSNFDSPFYYYEATVIMPDGTYRFIQLDSNTDSTNGTILDIAEDEGYGGTSLGSNWDLATGDYEYYPYFIGKAIGELSFSGGYRSSADGSGGSFAYGQNVKATGFYSGSLGRDNNSSGRGSFTANEGNTASGNSSSSFNEFNISSGYVSFSVNRSNFSRSYAEFSAGSYGTDYTPIGTNVFNSSDRLFNFGNGTFNANRHDAFTGLKNGQIGIGIDNFESNTTGEKLQVNGKVKASDLKLTTLPTYADDAAAGVGGLVVGDVYKTATGELRIKL